VLLVHICSRPHCPHRRVPIANDPRLPAHKPRTPGVPTDLYHAYPAIKAFHARIAALPEVSDFYSHVTEGNRTTYKGLP